MRNDITAAGFTSSRGDKWVRLKRGAEQACVPLRHFHGNCKSALDRLAEKEFCVIGAAATRSLIDHVAALHDFPPMPCIEQVGWNGSCFALPDGTVFAPDGDATGEVLIDPIPERCTARGTLKGWKRDVASPLAGQSIPIFALCFAYTAPILSIAKRSGNFGFEIVGGKGAGKSTVQQLASSVLGGVIQGEDGHYWQTFDTTLTALDNAMAGHSDLPMILEEANLFFAGSSNRVRADNFLAVAFRLANGTEKARHGTAPLREFRFVYLTSSNEPLANLIGIDSASAAAAKGRLITIPIASARRHGVFDHIPTTFASGGEFAAAVIAAADMHHGVSIRKFLPLLVEARATDEGALRGDIERWVTSFVTKAKVDRNDGSATRVAEAFGLVYAASKLAIRYKALPASLRCGPAILACYKLHLKKLACRTRFLSVLIQS